MKSIRRVCHLKVLFLILLVWALCAAEGVLAGQRFNPSAWPKDTGAPVNSSPVLGDLDGDGALEIVIGTDNHKVYAWKPDGTLMPGWPVTTGDAVRSSPALADIDGDGRLDVIVGSFDNKVYAWNFNGSLLPGWPAVTGSVIYSSPAIGDIDGDQLPEVVAGSFDNKVYAWNADGTLVRGWPKPTGLFVYSSPALADIDHDGLPEIIVGTDNNRVFAWNGDGTEVEGWPTATEHVVPSSPAIGDIDLDGTLEIVVGSWDKVFVWNSQGERKPGWPVTAGHQIPSSPALADLNNDGTLEIITGCKDGRVYVWDANGQLLQGWPTVTDAEISASPAIADLDGDGNLEVIIGSKDSKIYVWDAEGRLLPGWPKNTGDAISSSPAIADLDHDGTLEVIVGSKDNKVYAWNFPRTGSFQPKVVWQNFHGNPAHTGVYAEKPMVAHVTKPTSRVIPARPLSQPQLSESPTVSQQPPFSEPVRLAPQPIVPREIIDGYVNDLIISDYDQTTVTLTWTSPSGVRPAQTIYDIRYSPQPITEETWNTALPYAEKIEPALPGEREVHQLSQPRVSGAPQPDILYLALKVVENSGGELTAIHPISNVVRLERPDTEPPARIQDITITELRESLLELSWQASGDDGTFGTAATYDIRYSDVPLNEVTWPRATQIDPAPAPLPSGSEQRFQVQQPWDDREIFWGIKVIDDALNISDLSKVAVWSPQDDIPPARIVDLRVTKLSGNTATLTWTAPGNNLHVGTAHQYDIRYADFPISESDWDAATAVSAPPAPKNAGTSQTYVLQGIPFDATVFVGIKTLDWNGNTSILSNVVETAMDDVSPPAAVLDLKVEQVGKDWARVTWTAQGDDDHQGLAAAYVLRYGGNLRVVKSWNNAIDVQELPSPSNAGARETAVIRGLSENSTYYVGLRVLDEQGNSSDLSNILRVQTLGRSTPEAITDLAFEELRADGITLNWTAPQDFGETSSTVSGYDLRYSTEEISEENWGAAIKFAQTPSPSAPKTLEAFTVSGGPRETAFYIAIKSYDALGNLSPLSNVVHIPRIDTVPPAPIIDLLVEESGRDWVRLNWTAAGDNQDEGQASKVRIRMASSLQQLREWNTAKDVPNTYQPAVAGMKESFTITGVQSDATFFVALKSIDAFGNESEMSNIVRAKTKDAVPPAAIRDLRPIDIQKDTVVLQWTAPGENGVTGQAKAYDVRYAQEPIAVTNWDTALTVPLVPRPASAGSLESVSVSTLQPNTQYYFAVVTLDASGNASPLSNVIGVVVGDTLAPEQITSLRAETVDRNSVFLSWMSPGDDEFHEQPSQYDIRYANTPLTEANWSNATSVEAPPQPSAKGEQERFLLSGLQPDSFYSIGIKSLDADGNVSPLSNLVQIHTSENVVTDVKILDFSGESVTLTWTTPGGVLHVGDRLYDIRYATTAITDENWDDAPMVPSLTETERLVKQPGEKEKVTIQGLPSYEQMFFAVRVLSDSALAPQQVSALSNVVELNRLDLTPPSAIENLAVNDLGKTPDGKQSLEFTWQAPGDNDSDGIAAKYEFHYGIEPPTETNWSSLAAASNLPVPQIAGTPQQVILTIPPGEDTLYFAIRTFDEAFNVSGVSNIASWAPEDKIPPAPITDLTAERLENGDIRLSWTASGDNADRGVAALYDIRYARNESDLKKWDKAQVVPGEPLPEAAGTSQEYTITGLRNDTAYYIAMTMTDDARNTSEVSNMIVVPEVPPEQIDDVAFVGGTDSTVTISWTAPRDRVSSERIIKYEIRYAETLEKIEQWKRAKKVKQSLVPQEPGSTESIVIEDLAPNSRYYFAIKAVEHQGEHSALSNIVAADTSDTIAPLAINNLTVKATQQDAVTLTWTVVEDDQMHELPELYDIRYSLAPLDEANWETAEVVETTLQPSERGEQMEYTVAGLAENSRYYFSIRAIDAAGNLSALSNIAVARTNDVTPPPAITDLRAMFPTATSVTLTWTGPSDPVGIRALSLDEAADSGAVDEQTMLSAYDIRYVEVPLSKKPLDETVWEQAEKVLVPPKPLTPGLREEFVVRNLKPGTSYYFAIKSVDQSDNVSMLSNTIQNATLPAEDVLTTSPRTLTSAESLGWELVQGTNIGELQQDAAGHVVLKKHTTDRGLVAGQVMTAVYPQGKSRLALQQGEWTFYVKSEAPFSVCARVMSADASGPYFLCYASQEGIDTAQIQRADEAERETPAASSQRKRIENYVYYPLEETILDGDWHEIRLNLAEDLLEGTGLSYQETTRFSIRGADVAFREMTLQGAVLTPIDDFEDQQNPGDNGWKLHFGTGIIELERESDQGNAFLHAKSASDQGIVVTYPRDGSAQLSDKPFLQVNVRDMREDFKLIVKVRTKDQREYYLAYVPESLSGNSSSSGNYLYFPLSVTTDASGWNLLRLNLADDLRRNQLEYEYTSWLSFHGRELRLDNVNFSTGILESALK